MAQKQDRVRLPPAERTTLEPFVSRGQKKAREITRARALLFADEGKRTGEITALLGISRPTRCLTRRRYGEKKELPILQRLQDAPRQGRPLKVDSRLAARISLIAGSDPPQERPAGPCS